MAAVCQESTNPDTTLFGSKPLQGPNHHNYYPHCGYPIQAHCQYGSDGYSHYQTPTTEQQAQHQLHPHQQHHPRHQQHQHQQSWGYGMGMAMMGSTRSPQVQIPEEWSHGYLLPGSGGSPSQNPYNYQYRTPTNTHNPMDYTDHNGHEPDPQGLDSSSSPHTPSPGGPPTPGMTQNNHGAKSLRAPYEWMKPSASLPAAGKTRTKDKYRVVYSDHQRLELEKEFHFSKYITIRRKAEIAGQLGLSERQVKIWFQNRRAKERKQNKKREEQALAQQHQLQQQHNNQNNTNIGGHQTSANFTPPLLQQQHQQQNLLPPSLVPKIEVDDDNGQISSRNGVNCHNSSLGHIPCHPAQAPPNASSDQSLLPLHTPPPMTAASVMMERNHAHLQSIGRYHENRPGLRRGISPTSNIDDIMTLRMAHSDTSNTSMNLSGSSDSGVMSSH